MPVTRPGPESTARYTPPKVSGYFPSDLYNFGAPPTPQQQNKARPNFQARVVQTTPEGQVVQWRAMITDVRGGLNTTVGDYESDFDRASSSTADSRFYRSLILPQLTTSAATPDPGGTLVGIHSANFNSLLHVGMGSTTDSSLFAETSATNPAMAAVTYTPTDPITSLSVVSAGGTAAALRLAVGLRVTTNPVDLLDTSYAATAMHADTGGCWGIIQTFINNNTLLIYSQTAIRTLDSTIDVTTAPTVTLSSVPAGGCALGLVKLAGAPIRAAWLWPLDSVANGALLSTAEKPMRVVTTNQEGTDYHEEPVGLKYVFAACIINKSMTAQTDKERITLYDGRGSARDIGWIADREPNSDRVYECRGLAANGNELWIRVNHKASAAATANTNTNAWWEVYNLETNSFHTASGTLNLTSTGSFGLLPGGPLPLSESTGFLQDYVEGQWRRVFVPVYGYNPYTLYRQTSGADSDTGNEYEASATWSSPEWELPGLEGWPKIVNRILFLGDVDAGGTAATAASVQVSAGNQTATFGTGLSGRAQIVDVEDNGDMFYRLQVDVTLARTTGSTRFTPNALPLVVEGYAFIGNPMPPAEFMWDVR